MRENIRLSFRGIFSHKLRSFLTMLGIIIGIAAIIAIVSTIQGTNQQIQKNLIGSGTNNVNVRLTQGDWEYDFSGGIPSSIKEITPEQAAELASIENATIISIYRNRQDYEGVFRLNNALRGGSICGIDTKYFAASGLTIKRGRSISERDIASFAKVCVLDKNSLTALFRNDDPIGQTVEIKGEPFKVIGVAVEKQEFEPEINTLDEYYTYNQDKSGKVFIPESVWPVIYQYDEPQNVVIRAADTKDMTKIGKAAEKILNANIREGSDIKYKARDLMEKAREIQQLSKSTNTMLIWIAGISLLVGGIGVMNIMLVSVTERTSEIGLKKAIGAPKKAIMIQFLTEAVVLTFTGGVIGVITGIILAELISQINEAPVAISWPAAFFAVIFSMMIGIVFGILPSHKAANLDPIEALRHE